MKNNYFNSLSSYADFPKKGVIYWDIAPLHENPVLFRNAIKDIKRYFEKKPITRIVAIEAKGFILGGALAYEMGVPLSLIRKPGLTPGKMVTTDFHKEYGNAAYEARQGVFNKDDHILLVYDILAGPGATKAAIRLLEQQNATIAGCAYIVELEYLNGRESLADYDIFSLVKIRTKQLK